MNTYYLLAIFLQLSSAIDIKFSNHYENTIKKIEIPYCIEEPCVIIKGQTQRVKITFESAYPKHHEYKDIKDLEVQIYANGYRDRFVYYLTEIDSVCQKLIIECPISKNYIYTIDVPMYLPSDDEVEIGKNGKQGITFSLIMKSSDGGTVIGSAFAVMDFESPL